LLYWIVNFFNNKTTHAIIMNSGEGSTILDEILFSFRMYILG
jgi:hypothetical protein